MRIQDLFFLSIFFISINTGIAQNHSLHFDGINDYVNLGVNAGDGLRSIELWFRLDDEVLSNNSERITLLTRDSEDQTGEFGIFIGYDCFGEQGRVTFTRQVGSTFYYVYSDQNSWEPNKWYHVAGVIDPETGMKMYIDGVLQQDTDPSFQATANENENTAIGCWGDRHFRWFEGEIDELRFWDRAISSEEINEFMCESIDPQGADGLVGYWKMDEGSGSTLINYGEEGSSGSIEGAVYVQDIICSSSNPPNPLWLKAIQGNQNDEGLGMAVDEAGYPVCCGYFTSDKLYAGSMFLDRESSCDAYVIKYNLNGDPVWMDNPGGTVHQEAHAIGADHQNNIYVTGLFKGSFQFAGTELTAQLGSDAFLLKYDKDGNEVWGLAMNSYGAAEGREMAIDQDGNIILGLWFSDNDLSIGGTTLYNNGSLDVAIVKFTPDGELIWAKSFGGYDLDFICGLCTDIEGKIYFTGGIHSSQITLGNYNFTNTSTKRAAIIVQMSPDGEVIWAENHSDGYDQQFMAIAVDSNFNIYSGGYYKGDFIFGTEMITNNAGHFDVFLAKYNADHEHQWIKQIASEDYERTDALALGENGNIYLEVVTFGDITFGDITANNNGERDMAIAKYDPEGEVQWVLHAGGEDNDRSFSMASGPHGNVYFTGYFYSQQLEMGEHQIQNMGEMDAFIAALGSGCPPPDPTFYYSVEGFEVMLTANGIADTYFWDFGDGDSSSEMNPTHTYASFGDYEVCLTVNDVCGQNIACEIVTICVDPTADFAFDVNELEVAFYQFSNLADDYQWDFGDGIHSYEAEPVHTYEDFGNYIVGLTVFNDCGAGQHFDTIYLLEPMMCNFSFTLDENGVVQFHDESLDAMSCYWEFGDGTTSTEQNPSHQYKANGTYHCCLTIENGEGSFNFCDDVVVENFQEEQTELNVYIDPFGKSLKINIPVDGNYEIIIYNTRGKLAFSDELSLSGNSVYELGLTSLTAGVYIVSIQSEQLHERIKVMVPPF